jgi:hypothetical protein
LLAVSGSGTKTSGEFTTSRDKFQINYNFNCSSFGSQGNFQIYVYEGSALVDVAVNDLAASGADTTFEYQGAGTFHLQMNSECTWTVEVYE